MLSPADFLDMQATMAAEVPRRCACGQSNPAKVKWSCALGVWVCSYCWFKAPKVDWSP